MNISEIISGLNDLKRDAESHREADGTIEDVFQHDIEVLEAAVRVVAAPKKEYAVLEKCWYRYFTGKQGKREHRKIMLICDECHYVWDTQAYAFNYCPNCGRQIVQEDEE